MEKLERNKIDTEGSRFAQELKQEILELRQKVHEAEIKVFKVSGETKSRSLPEEIKVRSEIIGLLDDAAYRRQPRKTALESIKKAFAIIKERGIRLPADDALGAPRADTKDMVAPRYWKRIKEIFEKYPSIPAHPNEPGHPHKSEQEDLPKAA